MSVVTKVFSFMTYYAKYMGKCYIIQLIFNIIQDFDHFMHSGQC